MIQVASELTLQALHSLAAGEVLAIRVKNFLSTEECSILKTFVFANKNFRFDGPGFRGLGPGSFSLPAAAAEYFDSKVEIDRILRLPFERLQDGVGQLIAASYGQFGEMRALTARSYSAQFMARPHQDRDQHHYPWSISQLGISLALETPHTGGALRVWDLALSDFDYANHVLPNGFELDESKLPKEDLKIFAEPGELVILDARRIHAIDFLTKGVRTSISGFLTPLNNCALIWS